MLVVVWPFEAWEAWKAWIMFTCRYQSPLTPLPEKIIISTQFAFHIASSRIWKFDSRNFWRFRVFVARALSTLKRHLGEEIPCSRVELARCNFSLRIAIGRDITWKHQSQSVTKSAAKLFLLSSLPWISRYLHWWKLDQSIRAPSVRPHCPNLPRDFFHENQKVIFKQSSTTQQQRKVFVAQLVRALVSYSYMRWLLTTTLAIQRSRVRVSPRTICFCFWNRFCVLND